MVARDTEAALQVGPTKHWPAMIDTADCGLKENICMKQQERLQRRQTDKEE